MSDPTEYEGRPIEQKIDEDNINKSKSLHNPDHRYYCAIPADSKDWWLKRVQCLPLGLSKSKHMIQMAEFVDDIPMHFRTWPPFECGMIAVLVDHYQ